MSDKTGTQALWPQMISALAEIDRELGLPDDGCNSTAQTLAEIRALKAKAATAQSLALAVMGDQTSHDNGVHAVLLGLLNDCAAVLRTIDPDDSDEAEKLADLLAAIDLAQAPDRHKGELP